MLAKHAKHIVKLLNRGKDLKKSTREMFSFFHVIQLISQRVKNNFYQDCSVLRFLKLYLHISYFKRMTLASSIQCSSQIKNDYINSDLCIKHPIISHYTIIGST